jgi:hypothetical protein
MKFFRRVACGLRTRRLLGLVGRTAKALQRAVTTEGVFQRKSAALNARTRFERIVKSACAPANATTNIASDRLLMTEYSTQISMHLCADRVLAVL